MSDTLAGAANLQRPAAAADGRSTPEGSRYRPLLGSDMGDYDILDGSMVTRFGSPVGDALKTVSSKAAPPAEAFAGGGTMAIASSAALPLGSTIAAPGDEIDLSQYVLVARYDLPTPANSTVPANSALAEEVSAITYNWDSDTLFVIGDEGTSIVEVSKTGVLVSSMTIAAGAFEDTEGLAYIGNGQFVLIEERDRTIARFTYTADGTLARIDAEIVDLGTNAGNLGLEGVAWDPLTGGFVLVKENAPQGVFQTGVDFAAGTAGNGSAITVNSANLFDPALLGLVDIADVFALSALPWTAGTDQADDLLILSQESGLVLRVDRDGTILSQLSIAGPAGNPLDVVAQGHEGITMDRDGNIYIVSEQGGGADIPQVWVYRPADFPNAAPTSLTLANQLGEIVENSNTGNRIKVADLVIADDGIGTNILGLTGADAAFFEVDGTGLYLRAGTVLDYETRTGYSVTVTVDDPSIGATPDASASYTLAVIDLVTEGGGPAVIISEVAPWASGDSPVGVDWFELSNTTATAINISGWRFDDDSASFAESDPLLGIGSIAAGESVIFLNTSDLAGASAAFIDTWFGGIAPIGLRFGAYDGAGLGTGGDAITLFDASGSVQTSVSFGASPGGSPFATLDNSAAISGGAIGTLSKVGAGYAFAVTNAEGNVEIGSPGTMGKVFISEIAPWSSGESTVGEDWFELTNTSTVAVTIAGWRLDDDSASFAESDPLLGITTIAAGESVIFLNTTDLAGVSAAFVDTWFGGNAPAALRFGTYDGAGLGNGGDAITLFDAVGTVQTAIRFGQSTLAPALATFDNAAGLEYATITALSSPGTNGAATIINSDGNSETGSPGSIVTVAPPVNAAPAAVTLINPVTTLAENTATPLRIKLADLSITDDGVGFNALSLSGADAAFFEIDASGLYLKAYTQLDFETKADYQVTIVVDDPSVGSTPDATTSFTLSVTDIAAETGPAIIISEVAPWASDDSPVGEDWFEITNVSGAAVDLSGWRFDDDSASFAESDALQSIGIIGAGETVIFLNTIDLAGVSAAFVNTWFGGIAPPDLRFGSYDGAGLGAGGDAVVLFDTAGTIQSNVRFGASPGSPFATFDNAAGITNGTISAFSTVGSNGGFVALASPDETGSPGTIDSGENDLLVGDAGDNGLAGGAGDDTIYGGAGNDRLSGGAGANSFIGGAGNDTFVIDGAFINGGTATVLDFAVGDTLFFQSLGNARITFDQVGANTRISANGGLVATITGTEAAEVLAAAEFQFQPRSVGLLDAGELVSQLVNGSNQADTLTGRANVRNTIDGQAGNDIIAGRNLDDVLMGAGGDDMLEGAGGDDVLVGGAGNDRLFGGNGDDTLIGGAGNDLLGGGRGANILTGGAGADTFRFDRSNTGVDRVTDYDVQRDSMVFEGRPGRISFADGQDGAEMFFGDRLLAIFEGVSASAMAGEVAQPTGALANSAAWFVDYAFA